MIDEAGTRQTQEIVGAALTVATSTISYVETRAALARMRAGHRIDARRLRAARRQLDDMWLDLISIPTDDELLAEAADLADTHSLRGYDSIQLAAADSLRKAGSVTFTCWDVELNEAARSAGLELAAL